MSSDVKDAYTLAITSYALTLVGSSRRTKAVNELRKLATEKGKPTIGWLAVLSTPSGLQALNSMPFGLTNLPSSF